MRKTRMRAKAVEAVKSYVLENRTGLAVASKFKTDYVNYGTCYLKIACSFFSVFFCLNMIK